MQSEQFLLARRIERTGACINAGARARPVDYRALVHELIAGGSARAAARAFAEQHGGFSHGQQTLDLCDAIEATFPASRERARAREHHVK